MRLGFIKEDKENHEDSSTTNSCSCSEGVNSECEGSCCSYNAGFEDNGCDCCNDCCECNDYCEKGSDSESELEILKRDNAVLKDKFVRLAAEYDNFKKRTAKERQQIADSTVSEVMLNILPALDNINRALDIKVVTDEAKKFHDGIKMILSKIEGCFEKIGITKIEAYMKPFDPNIHEAILHVDDKNMGENIIIEEIITGYMYKDKVIRHSIVKVAN